MNRLNNTIPSSPEETARLWREGLSHWTVDTYRALDYLQSREDFDEDNIFYMGMSHGALFPTHTLLFEKRFKAAILYVGGVFTASDITEFVCLVSESVNNNLQSVGEYILNFLISFTEDVSDENTEEQIAGNFKGNFIMRLNIF